MSRADPASRPSISRIRAVPIPAAVHRRIDRHPVEIEGAEGAGGGAPADPAGETAVELGAHGDVVGRARHRGVEDLEGDGDLVVRGRPGPHG